MFEPEITAEDEDIQKVTFSMNERTLCQEKVWPLTCIITLLQKVTPYLILEFWLRLTQQAIGAKLVALEAVLGSGNQRHASSIEFK